MILDFLVGAGVLVVLVSVCAILAWDERVHAVVMFVLLTAAFVLMVCGFGAMARDWWVAR